MHDTSNHKIIPLVISLATKFYSLTDITSYQGRRNDKKANAQRGANAHQRAPL